MDKKLFIGVVTLFLLGGCSQVVNFGTKANETQKEAKEKLLETYTKINSLNSFEIDRYANEENAPIQKIIRAVWNMEYKSNIKYDKANGKVEVHSLTNEKGIGTINAIFGDLKNHTFYTNEENATLLKPQTEEDKQKMKNTYIEISKQEAENKTIFPSNLKEYNPSSYKNINAKNFNFLPLTEAEKQKGIQAKITFTLSGKEAQAIFEQWNIKSLIPKSNSENSNIKVESFSYIITINTEEKPEMEVIRVVVNINSVDKVININSAWKNENVPIKFNMNPNPENILKLEKVF